jgi:hypothetical protein
VMARSNLRSSDSFSVKCTTENHGLFKRTNFQSALHCRWKLQMQT